MYYVVLTTHHNRPYLSKIAFIARDFESWGCRVDHYPDDSPYIAEIQRREKRGNRREVRRVNIMELWAREVVARKYEFRSRMPMAIPVVTEEHLPGESRRHARTSEIVQDFIWGLVAFGMYIAMCAWSPAFGSCGSSAIELTPRYHTIQPKSHSSRPSGHGVPISPITEAGRCCARSDGSDGKGEAGQGSVEWDASTGLTKVTLFVEVSDCMVDQYDDDVETRDPVPAYESGERPPAYVST
ncbi:hypothetical protein IAQ61_003576 [Plenodomus lingam]|uniref:uncharacterized protein n=1 Tax=Leptosphaeria maculans TaxID=5022 RepID=UPI00332363C4|nr:hypothetical protein IAQ61_003576 [Plenodomus lingam]